MQDIYCDIKDRLSPPSTATTTVTQTCSEAFEMTGNDALLSRFEEQEESSIMESQKKESSEWTNEKHSLYLKSIEASFVDQLYNSLEMQSCQTQKTSSSNAITSWKNLTNTRIPSGQFKVLQGGCWSNKKFKRENPQQKDSKRPSDSQVNPWIQHFTNGRKHGAMESSSLHEKPLMTATSQKNSVPDSQFYQEPGCSNTEVTDQNFVEAPTTQKANRPRNKKRTRTTTVTHSNNDQVVPFCASRETAKK